MLRCTFYGENDSFIIYSFRLLKLSINYCSITRKCVSNIKQLLILERLIYFYIKWSISLINTNKILDVSYLFTNIRSFKIFYLISLVYY